MINKTYTSEAIVNLAEKMLSRQFDQVVRLGLDRVFSSFKSVVVRCRVERNSASLPEALIVKKAREDRIGYFPDSEAAQNAAHELFNDWAAARFLDGLGHDPPLSPRFYAGDRENGLIVLEDLGDGEAPNTMVALLGHDRGLVEAGARWNILHLIHRVPTALSGDYQRGLTTLRQQVVAWLDAFADLSDERQQLQALGKSAREAAQRLRELWPAEVCGLPYYPAFRVI